MGGGETQAVDAAHQRRVGAADQGEEGTGGGEEVAGEGGVNEALPNGVLFQFGS
jgi:hypothetical protein